MNSESGGRPRPASVSTVSKVSATTCDPRYGVLPSGGVHMQGVIALWVAIAPRRWAAAPPLPPPNGILVEDRDSCPSKCFRASRVAGRSAVPVNDPLRSPRNACSPWVRFWWMDLCGERGAEFGIAGRRGADVGASALGRGATRQISLPGGDRHGCGRLLSSE